MNKGTAEEKATLTREQVHELAITLSRRFATFPMPAFSDLERVLVEVLCPEKYHVQFLDSDREDEEDAYATIIITDDLVHLDIEMGSAARITSTHKGYSWNRKTKQFSVVDSKKPKAPGAIS